MVRCDVCGHEENTPDASFCKECGNAFQPPAPAPAPAPAPGLAYLRLPDN